MNQWSSDFHQLCPFFIKTTSLKGEEFFQLKAFPYGWKTLELSSLEFVQFSLCRCLTALWELCLWNHSKSEMGFQFLQWEDPYGPCRGKTCLQGFANNKEQRSRPTCASLQSDQRLCYSLYEKYSSQACFMQNFNILASLCSWGDWFEPRFVGNPKDRFCRVAAYIICGTLE